MLVRLCLNTAIDISGRIDGKGGRISLLEFPLRDSRQAGIGKIHLHQLRHSFARMAGDESGSMSAVQEALGHKSIATTKIYLESVRVRRDQFSSRLAERLGIGSELEGVV